MIHSHRLPRIDDSTFVESDRQQVDSILILLDLLNSFVDDFRADLELFNHAETDLVSLGHWSRIACRDAAFAILNFQDALDQIKHALKCCAPLKTIERERALRAVIGRFGAAFPDAKPIRNVTAHPVSHIGTPKNRKDNKLRGSALLIHNSRINRTVSHSKNGRLISFDMTDQTLETLGRIQAAAFKVFQENAE